MSKLDFIKNGDREQLGNFYLTQALQFASQNEIGKAAAFIIEGLDLITYEPSLNHRQVDGRIDKHVIFSDINYSGTNQADYYFVKAYVYSLELHPKWLYSGIDAIDRYLRYKECGYGYYIKGKLLMKLKQYNLALEVLKYALKLSPLNSRLNYIIGYIKEEHLFKYGVNSIYQSFLANPFSTTCGKALLSCTRRRRINLTIPEHLITNSLITAFQKDWVGEDFIKELNKLMRLPSFNTSTTFQGFLEFLASNRDMYNEKRKIVYFKGDVVDDNFKETDFDILYINEESRQFFVQCFNCKRKTLLEFDHCEYCNTKLFKTRDKLRLIPEELAKLWEGFSVHVYRNSSGDCIYRFEDSSHSYQSGNYTNSEYGRMFVVTYSYVEIEDKALYDNWHPEMESLYALTGIIGKVTDLEKLLSLHSDKFDVLPGKLVGIKYPESKVPQRFLDRYNKTPIEKFYVNAGEDGEVLTLNGEPVCRFFEYVLPETVYVTETVTIQLNDAGELITKCDESYGSLEVSAEVFVVENGHLEIKTRFAKIKGELADLEELVADADVQNSIPGRIVVCEFEEDAIPSKYKWLYLPDETIEYEKRIFNFIKKAPNGENLLSEKSKRIFSFPKYVSPASNEVDILVQHQYDELVEDWRQDRYKSDNESSYEDDLNYEYEHNRKYGSYYNDDILNGDPFEGDPMNRWNID